MSDPGRSLRMGWSQARPGPSTRPLSGEVPVMPRPPTAAQRRVIDAADPVTGRLRGTEAQLDALVKRGLAFRHPRPPHDHFLTPTGHRIREAFPEAPAPAVAPPPAPGALTARVRGEENAPDSAQVTGPVRTREVHSAWQGLLEL